MVRNYKSFDCLYKRVYGPRAAVLGEGTSLLERGSESERVNGRKREAKRGHSGGITWNGMAWT